MKRLLIIYLFCCSGTMSIASTGRSVFDIPLEDLLNTPVAVGGHLDTSKSDAPASITTISRHAIAITPARNLLDLLEIYVPGTTFVIHYNGPRIGIRGTLGDQNDSFLLLVNGKNMNMKTGDAILLEVNNRDLGDIERIEVIRGPGSVTHGPGAIGGVINIVTRDSHQDEGWEFSTDVNQRYRYRTARTGYSWKTDNFSGFVYGSISQSDGESDTDYFYVDRAHGYGYGYMSETWGNKGLGTKAPDYFDDFKARPEIKLHFDGQFGQNWHLWGRYTDSNFTKFTQASRYADGIFFQGNSYNSLALTLTHKLNLDPRLNLETSLCFDGVNTREHVNMNPEASYGDPVHLRGSYSENEVHLESILRYKSSGESFKMACGVSSSYEFWRPEWGKSDKTFCIWFPPPIRGGVLSTESSIFQRYGESGFATLLEESPHAWTCSFFAQSSITVHPDLEIDLASRFDKHEMAKWAISPRLGILYKMTSQDSLRFILQQSVRLPAFEDLYVQSINQQSDPDPEVVDVIELIYSRKLKKHWDVSLAGFFNKTEQIAWLPDGYAGVIGEFRLWGLELESAFHGDWFHGGLSYSFIDQIDWDPRTTIDTNLTTPEGDPIPISDEYGENRINNLPGHSLKLHSNISLSQNLIFHVNGRLYWDFGQADMLTMFYDAHQNSGSDETRNEMADIYKTMTGHGYSEAAFTMNASLQWHLPFQTVDTSLSLYGMNLLKNNHLRYVIQYWETLSRQYPRQCSFIEEPASFGVKLTMKL